MKLLKITVILLATAILPIAASHASDIGDGENAKNFDKYLRNFDYDERKAMKIRVNDLLKLYKQGKVQIIDIRFQEEAAAWEMGFTTHIPLNELPDRLNELDKDKIIVTVCPHYDRAAIARHYLTLKGYDSRYLVDGLLGLAEYLRGDKARDFINDVSKK